MMADPSVAYWLGGELTPAQRTPAFDRTRMAMDADGFGMWAAERTSDGALLGSIGIRRVIPGHPLAGELELGWRLTRGAWGSATPPKEPPRRWPGASIASMPRS